MTAPIRRACVTLGSRQVHVRHAGAGPVVTLVHQSPTSARTLDLQTAAFGAAGFHAIAIDIPGLGQSDPIGLAQPEIADQAIALAEFLDAIGVQRTALYGSHTGALICVEFARRWPERVRAVLTDGYPIYTPGERERRVATYFPPFEVSWEGAHLLWLWFRYREQYLFWPWNVPGESTRAQCDIPDPVFLHEGMVDVLRAGNEYRRAYGAAFRYRSEEPIRELKVPLYFLTYPDDSLTRALALIPSMPESCRIEQMPLDRHEGVSREIEILRRHAEPDGERARLETMPRIAGVTRSYVDVPGGQLALRRSGRPNGRPLVVIPPAPGSASTLQAELESLGKQREVLALDVPGCGNSDSFGDPGVDSMASAISAALLALGVDDFDLYALNGGCAPAVGLALASTDRIGRVVLESPANIGNAEIARYAPAIEPRWDGSHLIALWHAVRNRRLFRPWYDQRLAARRTGGPDLDPEALNAEVLAYLESWRTYHAAWQSVLQHPTISEAKRIRANLMFAGRAGDEFCDVTRSSVDPLRFMALDEAVLPRTMQLLGHLGGQGSAAALR